MELRRIQVYEFGWLRVGSFYDDIEFKQIHFDLLVQYLTVNPSCPYYSLFHQRIKFKNYVGVIKVRDLLIEVLPKTDHHEETKDVWQRILLQMLNIALSVEAKTTTKANINLKHGNVLETYILHFLRETESIIYEGLVKKYRVNESNKYALTGKLIIHKQITKNLVHAERFWVLHQIYDHDNIYNRILYETLKVITTLKISQDLTNHAKFLTDFFPECSMQKISETILDNLKFGRKTERYKQATEFARIILLNYHPDIKGGTNNVLAIMFDMNLLWESFIYKILWKAASEFDMIKSIKSQKKALYWKHPDNWNIRLKPDIVIETEEGNIVLDTKWKYKSDTTASDIRQMYAYSHYFKSASNYLVYPERLSANNVDLKEGNFYDPGTKNLSNSRCGLIWIDLLEEKNLDLTIGKKMLDKIMH